MRNKKKRRVPPVLWTLFHNRALTLSTALTSLLPPFTHSQCRFCNDRRCLRCNGMSFLLRPNDPSDYHTLLHRCFVVFSENSSTLSKFSPISHWSQIQIVRAVIETTMLNQPMSSSSNVICSGYDNVDKSSAIVELLTSSAWCLLLERVGDGLMVYLLKNASIFLPTADKKHQQVTGPPISNLCRKTFKYTPNSQCQLALVAPCGPQRKRKRDDKGHLISKKKQLLSSVRNGESSCSVTSNSCLDHCGAFTPVTNTLSNDYEASSYRKLTDSLNTLKKRSRPFRWQRCRKRRQVSFEETNVKGPSKSICSEMLPGGLSSCLGASLGRHYEQVVQKVAKGAQIDRKLLYYNSERSPSVFPRKHVLNSVERDKSGSEFLVKSIFGIDDAGSTLSKTCPDGSGLSLMGSACLYQSLCKLLRILIRRAQYGHHLRLLEKHCSVSSLDSNTIKGGGCIFEGEKWESTQNSMHTHKSQYNCTADYCHTSPEVSDSLSEEVKSYCLKTQVESFIWAACRSVVPPELLGTPSNWRILRRTISKFIRLRRFEKFSLKQCMHKVKTSSFPFLSNKHDHCCMNNQSLKHVQAKSEDVQKESTTLNDAVHIVKVKLVENWIYWLFSSIVVPLLQANFYITESEHGKQDVHYYRKSVWEKVTNETIMTCMKDKSYHHLDDATTRRIIRKRLFGFSKLRICPKECGVRLLANLRASSKIPGKEFDLAVQSSRILKGNKLHRRKVRFEHFKSVNRVLRDTHVVLKAVQLKEPKNLGSSVFDYNDVYRKLCPFLIDLKNGLTVIPDVFIIASDVLKAFDSVDQNKLLGVLKDVIRADEYFLQQSHHVIFKKGSVRVHENHGLWDQNTSSRFGSYSSQLSLCTVLVNQECSWSVKKKELLFNLYEHVKRNVLKLDKRFYLQRIGIPQGSVLSTLLCSLYYGHLDRKVICPFLEKTREPATADFSGEHDFQFSSAARSSFEDKSSSSASFTLLRFVDDFLFVSTSKAQAASFFSRLQRGFRDYNCYMNEKKFCLNFDIGQMEGLPSNRVYSGDDGILFIRWSGLLINSCTLEIQADYTKYLKNHIGSTLTVLFQGKPGRHFKRKLCDYMRPKCHPLFFDSHINSASVVRLNIYQVFLLSAMKFHCYVRDLSYICKLDFRFYSNMIEKSVRYMHRLIRRKMLSFNTGSNFRPILQLEKEEVEWLGLHAFIQVLKRKQSRYKKLLSFLRSRLSNHKITGSLSSELSYAVDMSHSSLMWKIKY